MAVKLQVHRKKKSLSLAQAFSSKPIRRNTVETEFQGDLIHKVPLMRLRKVTLSVQLKMAAPLISHKRHK